MLQEKGGRGKEGEEGGVGRICKYFNLHLSHVLSLAL